MADCAARSARFGLTKFRPTTLPDTLVKRPMLHERLTAGAGKHLTVVIASAGSGKSVLLSSWAAARPPGVTSWLSCDEADVDPLRFWAGFIEAPRKMAPGFGTDAADLLSLDHDMSADVIASIVNDAAKLPSGSAIIVDDFHTAAAAVATNMTDLVERWPAESVQLVLAARVDPPLRLHRWRLSGGLCELRDSDLCLSLAECHDLLANFGVDVTGADLASLHRHSEGWAAAVQMAALSLRSAGDPQAAARSLDVRSHRIVDYFISEVLDQQPPELAQFMLDTSVLWELTPDACAAITDRPDTAALLRRIDAGNLFIVALDDDRTSYRYHRLARHVLHAELRARDRTRELALQRRAGEWFESVGETRRAIRHYLAARQDDRVLALLHDGLVADYLRDPVLEPAPDVSMLDRALRAAAPDRLLALATDMLLSGDVTGGGRYLDLLESIRPPMAPESGLAARFATLRCFRHALNGQADLAVVQGEAVRAIQERTAINDEWTATVPMVLLRAYLWLEDFPAIERETAVALATPTLSESVKRVQVPGALARAWFEYGRLADAADRARAAEAGAQQLGFDRHFFAVDHLRTLAGLALEACDLDAAEQSTERALSISEQRRPCFEFLAMLDRAEIWAARGQVRDALATIEAARRVLAGTGSVLLTRADELEALLRLSLGDLRSAAELASMLPATRGNLLLAKVALASDQPHVVEEHLRPAALGVLTPRRELVRQLLLAATAIVRRDTRISVLMTNALQTARRQGFLRTVVTTAPQLSSYLIEQSPQTRTDPFMQQLIAAAVDVRAGQPEAARARSGPVEPLTFAELRVLRLLPTSTYPQIAVTLHISRNTVKTHLRSIYQKLGVSARSRAVERAVELRLL